MNKFAFFFPAKIVFAERNIELEPLIFRDYTFYLGPIGKNIYFSSDEHRIVAGNSSNEIRQIFIKTGDYYSVVQSILISNIEDFLTRHFDFIQSAIPNRAAQINNPELYEREATERREKIKAERAAMDKEHEERAAERLRKSEEVYQASLKSFLSGEQIPWENVERAMKEFGVSLPIKTLGFARSNIVKICVEGAVTRGTHNSPVLWRAVRQLKQKMLDA